MHRPDVIPGKFNPELFDPTGRRLLVNEVFYTIQGEGRYTGHAAVFLRLAKCNLKCKFCDTEFEVGKFREVAELANAIEYAGGQGGGAFLVVITGGEPGLQNLQPLLNLLHARGAVVALETNGTVYQSWMEHVDHVCVSPKVLKEAIDARLINRLRDPGVPDRRLTGEVKWIVNTAWLALYDRDPEAVHVEGVTNLLQPESLDPKWTTMASKLVMSHPYRYNLCLQTHKYAGNP